MSTMWQRPCRYLWRPLSRYLSTSDVISSGRDVTTSSSDVTTSANDVIFSGIQPTGVPHIGNYLGAIKHWKQLQASADPVLYCIVDLHSITRSQEPETLRAHVRDMAAALLACGLDPARGVLFQQSTVPQHTELAWILACLTTLPQLSHQPQWREKSKTVQNPSVGLYTYPVLQSADILLYKAGKVPVGEDQIKHIELTRQIARTFNKKFGPLFPEPEVIMTSTKRIRSLRNPANKMSKSDENERSKIELNDSDQEIRIKIQKSVTDTLGKLTYDPESRPGVSNLLEIHSGFTDSSPEEICKQCQDMNMSAYKAHLSDVIIAHLAPIRDEFERLKCDGYVDEVLKNGSQKAREIASQNLDTVKEMVGFL